MYRVSYYMTAGTLTSKKFNTITEALRFSVYGVKPSWNVFQITKVEE